MHLSYTFCTILNDFSLDGNLFDSKIFSVLEYIVDSYFDTTIIWPVDTYQSCFIFCTIIVVGKYNEFMLQPYVWSYFCNCAYCLVQWIVHAYIFEQWLFEPLNPRNFGERMWEQFVGIKLHFSLISKNIIIIVLLIELENVSHWQWLSYRYSWCQHLIISRCHYYWLHCPHPISLFIWLFLIYSFKSLN